MTSETEDVTPAATAAAVVGDPPAASPVTTEAPAAETDTPPDAAAEDSAGGLVIHREAIVVESTGSVEFDGSPVTTEVVVDNTSSGAVALAGPVTTTVGWLADAQTKPVVAPEKVTPKKRPKQAQTKVVTAQVAKK